MRLVWIVGCAVCCVASLFYSGRCQGQQQGDWPAPFSEAERAMSFQQGAASKRDSLMTVYSKKWSIGFTLGQHFIGSQELSALPDTITFADLSRKNGFFGLNGSYFINDRWQVLMGIQTIVLSQKQAIDSITIGGGSIDVSGSGDGGVLLKVGLVGRYYLKAAHRTRPYAELTVGTIKAIAVGGRGSFSLGGGQVQEVERLEQDFNYGQLAVGLTHRLAPPVLFDMQLAYLKANRKGAIGGILSPSGVSLSIGLHFMLGVNKGP